MASIPTRVTVAGDELLLSQGAHSPAVGLSPHRTLADLCPLGNGVGDSGLDVAIITQKPSAKERGYH